MKFKPINTARIMRDAGKLSRDMNRDELSTTTIQKIRKNAEKYKLEITLWQGWIDVYLAERTKKGRKVYNVFSNTKKKNAK